MVSGIIVSLRRLMFGDKKSIYYNYIGRWTVIHCPKTINRRVEQANEDHCGCCNERIKDTDENKEYEEYCI